MGEETRMTEIPKPGYDAREEQPFMKKWSRKSTVWFLSAAIILCAGGTYAYFAWNGKNAPQAAAEERTVPIERGNLRSTISGTGQLEAERVKMIVPPKTGMIKTINLSRNQPVQEGDLLLELADPDLEGRLDSAYLTLEDLQVQLNDLHKQAAALQTRAPISGYLTLNTSVMEGASVSASTRIATIADLETLTLTIPFLQEEASQLQAGDEVQLDIDGFMIPKIGKVETVTEGTRADQRGNRLTDVIVRIANDGTLDAGLTARGSVNLGGVTVESRDAGTLQYNQVVPVIADVSGTIEQMVIKEDTFVKAGDLISVIRNNDLPNQIKQKENQITSQERTIADLQDQLEKLKIYAPFDGIFSTDFASDPNTINSYTAGTTVENNVQFGAVASGEYFQLPIEVDELDITKIEAGMKAEVTIDAIENRVFEAEVSQVSTVGTVTNGVTFFDVILKIKSTPELRYGMTATADIIVQDKRDILLAPIEAVSRQGREQIALVKHADGTTERRPITVGASNSTHVEIIEGLQEGDQVVIRQGGTRTQLSEEEINQMRQQYQQRGGAPGGNFRGGGPGGPVVVFPGGPAGGGMPR